MSAVATMSMRDAFSAIKTAEDFGYMLRDFLDRFRDNPDPALLADEPSLLAGVLNDDGLADAYLAATAAWLANKHRVGIPVWAKGASRALETPWFAAASHKLRMLLLQDSPTEFRIRNLFVSADALHRA